MGMVNGLFGAGWACELVFRCTILKASLAIEETGKFNTEVVSAHDAFVPDMVGSRLFRGKEDSPMRCSFRG